MKATHDIPLAESPAGRGAFLCSRSAHPSFLPRQSRRWRVPKQHWAVAAVSVIHRIIEVIPVPSLSTPTPRRQATTGSIPGTCAPPRTERAGVGARGDRSEGNRRSSNRSSNEFAHQWPIATIVNRGNTDRRTGSRQRKWPRPRWMRPGPLLCTGNRPGGLPTDPGALAALLAATFYLVLSGAEVATLFSFL
jgi:hypothetical protein